MSQLNAMQRWMMCSRKRSYETMSKANKAAAKHNLRVYECPACFCWHTTKRKEPPHYAE